MVIYGPNLESQRFMQAIGSIPLCCFINTLTFYVTVCVCLSITDVIHFCITASMLNEYYGALSLVWCEQTDRLLILTNLSTLHAGKEG